MAEFGLSCINLIPDGNIHRCNSSAKEKKNKDGWYIIHQKDDHYYAAFGCWIRREKSKASTNSSTKSNLEVWKFLDEKKIALDIERLNKAKKTASRYIKKHTIEASQDHEYLIQKGVGVYGNLRQSKNTLILPVINVNGDITSYQTISNKGRKRFLYQGVVAGGCYPISGDIKTVCVCEGYATGATIREATGYKVLVAFNAGNLEAVTKQAVHLFYSSEIIVCADNDHKTMERIGINPGIKTAKKIKNELGINYIYPTDITGSDFNDLSQEKGIESVRQSIIGRQTIELIEKKDCDTYDDTLIIPHGIEANGLISQGLEALEGDIIQYSLPLVLTIISRAIAGKISINGVHPNIFNIKVGGTSTGKTATDKRFMSCLDIPEFVSMNDVASGPGVWRAVSENPTGMGLFDEVSSLFMRANSKGGIDIIAEAKSNALMDLYSRSGQSFKKTFGDSKNNIMIDYPCVSIIGNATPTIFEAIQLRDFETGLMQRFDFWMYSGKIKPKPLIIGSSYVEKTKRWIFELKKLMDVKPEVETLASLIKETVELTAHEIALTRIREYSDHIVSEANKADSDGAVGFISRRFDLSLKYALIHHASKGADNIYSPITIDDIDWGILVAEMLSGWKVKILHSKVVSGEFHQHCEMFKSAIYSATKNSRKPNFRNLSMRKAGLKNWQPKYAENIISVLKKRGEIVTKEFNGSTLYYLPKEED